MRRCGCLCYAALTPNPTRNILSEIIVDDEITLRLQSPDNAELLHEIIDAERDRLAIERRVSFPATSAEHRNRLKEMDADRAARREIDYAIWLTKPSPDPAVPRQVPPWQMVGEVRFQDLEGENNAGLMHYWLRESCTGKGIMTRAARAMTRNGFEELKLNRIEISVISTNEASRGVPVRLGYEYEGTLRDEIVRLGAHHDLAIYSLLARVWRLG
ncbi:MAG: GNAT family N-acetyltransferase [Chloroflexi bacterium]|nr:GNAT family N-acetyltransferase [Chloroflexota bacterium]